MRAQKTSTRVARSKKCGLREVDASRSFGQLSGMSTLVEIEEAIEALPETEVVQLSAWLERRRQAKRTWPVAPPAVEREELERIETDIELAFPTLRP